MSKCWSLSERGCLLLRLDIVPHVHSTILVFFHTNDCCRSIKRGAGARCSSFFLSTFSSTRILCLKSPTHLSCKVRPFPHWPSQISLCDAQTWPWCRMFPFAPPRNHNSELYRSQGSDPFGQKDQGKASRGIDPKVKLTLHSINSKHYVSFLFCSWFYLSKFSFLFLLMLVIMVSYIS